MKGEPLAGMTSAVRLTYNTVAVFRKTLTILSLIGLLLSVGLWGVSGRQALRFTCGSKQHGMAVEIDNGELKILSRQRIYVAIARADPSQVVQNWVDAELVELSVRLFVLAILSGAVLTYCLMPFHRRRKREKLGLCLKCGYDLRASKERCPECGSEFESSGV